MISGVFVFNDRILAHCMSSNETDALTETAAAADVGSWRKVVLRML